MSGTVKIFFIATVVLLACDVFTASSASSACYKNQSYKSTGSSMNIFQTADLETETKTKGVIRNTPAVILTTLSFNHSFLTTNQNNLLAHNLIFNSRSVLIVQHKLII